MSEKENWPNSLFKEMEWKIIIKLVKYLEYFFSNHFLQSLYFILESISIQSR